MMRDLLARVKVVKAKFRDIVSCEARACEGGGGIFISEVGGFISEVVSITSEVDNSISEIAVRRIVEEMKVLKLC